MAAFLGHPLNFDIKEPCAESDGPFQSLQTFSQITCLPAY